LRFTYPALFLFVVFTAVSATPAVAAGSKHLAVVGDSLATGFYFGLRDVIARSSVSSLVRRTKGATGLAPVKEYDWIAAARRIKRKDDPGIIVVCLGGNDRQDMFIGSKRLRRFTKAWWTEYRSRVDTFMSILASGDTPVFWVGLPTVRARKMSRDYANFNAVYEYFADKHGITYLDTYALTAIGKKSLRHSDGIHFTGHGNLVLGRIILRAIERSLAAGS
jgi:hypothetical protein